MGSAGHAAVLNRRLSVSGDERSGCTLPSSVPSFLFSLPPFSPYLSPYLLHEIETHSSTHPFSLTHAGHVHLYS